nr:hypothetical protein [Cumulibacter manganitolerans]
MSFSAPARRRFVSFRGCATGRCGEQAADVLDDDPFGLQRLDGRRHMRPQPGTGAGHEACSLADRGDVLTRESAAEHTDRLDSARVDGGDVSEVRGVGPVVGEDAGDGIVDLGEPDRAGVEDLLDGEVESAVPGEQRPDPPTAVVFFVADFVHEDSGRSVILGRHPR